MSTERNELSVLTCLRLASFPRAWLCLWKGAAVSLLFGFGERARSVSPEPYIPQHDSDFDLCSWERQSCLPVCQACPQDTSPLWELTSCKAGTPARGLAGVVSVKPGTKASSKYGLHWTGCFHSSKVMFFICGQHWTVGESAAAQSDAFWPQGQA